MVENSACYLATVIIIQRLIELYIAARNQRYVLAMGGREYSPEHYPLFLALHISWFIGWVYEATSSSQLSNIWYVWLSLFILAQGLRYWCMVSLGHFWNTRILIVPGKHRVQQGPYRFIPHPNYLAVCIELICVPLIFNAWSTAVIASLLNIVLLLGIRIPAEEKALQQLR